MKVRILGAHNTESRQTRMMTVLVDDVIALDAGALTSSLSFRSQLKIKAVLITHPHYDHIRDVPAFSMNLFLRGRSYDLFGSAAVRDTLQAHFLNGQVYPDFFQRPPENPVIKFNLTDPGQTFPVGGYQVRAVGLTHSVPAVGYQITTPAGQRIFYTGDTGPGLDDCWRQVSPDLLVIEVTTSNRWEKFARESLHMTPGLLRAELESFVNIHGYFPHVAAVHMNPDLQPEIEAELAQVSTDLQIKIIPAREGLVLEV